MTTSDRSLARRARIVGWIAVLAWVWAVLLLRNPFVDDAGTFLVVLVAWAFTAAWVATDAAYRDLRYGWWAFLAIVAGPIGFLIYVASRPPVPARCGRCGRPIPRADQHCPACGFESVCSRIRSALNRVAASFAESLAGTSGERARHTARYMSVALLGFGIFCRFVQPEEGLLSALLGLAYVLSFAAYWVLVPWWVYLDATWRRMDAVPWAVLTLVTNVFGLVTYLVVRYPDPRACPQCHAPLAIGLQRCPYCGAEAEPACPRCQAAVKPDWLYCPACAAQLPVAASGPDSPAVPSWSIRGTVLDARTNAPIADAQVKIDSKAAARATTTDSLGSFTLEDLEPRPYVLVATAEGYAQEAKALTPGVAGSARVHFSLQPVVATPASR